VLDLTAQRLHNQHLGSRPFPTAAAAVAWFGAVQAQDYLGALWAVGTRMKEPFEADVERALAVGSIVRTWPLRGTLHFVAAEDARWILQLLAPQVVARHAPRLEREYGLNEATIRRSRTIVRRALQGGKQLAREVLYGALEKGHVATGAQRGLHIVWRLAHEGLICFGPRHGKQQTFVLMDEWLPRTAAPPKPRSEAVADLALRFFASHGPATVADFAWWSGLSPSEAKKAAQDVSSDLEREEQDGQTYWLAPSTVRPKAPSSVLLLPPFDELTVAYKDRRPLFDAAFASQPNAAGLALGPVIVIEGKIAGTWKRVLRGSTVEIVPTLHRPLTHAETRALDQASERYASFLGRSLAS
jgi:hypothetical protein